MGSMLTSEAAKNDNDKAQGSLEMLMTMANKQKEIYDDEIINFYSNPQSFQKYEVVGGRIISKSSFVSSSTKVGTDPDIVNGVDNIISGLFGGNSAGDDFKKGVTSLVSGAFKALLGESAASETKQNEFFIVPHGYTFYRIDVYMYKYNVHSSAGAYTISKSVYVTCTAMGVLDHTKLTTDELIAFASQIVGSDKTKLIDWFNKFAKITNKIQELDLTAKEIKKEEKNQNNTNNSSTSNGNK